MENIKHDKYGSIRLENQICFPLYACAKEVVRQYRKPLEHLVESSMMGDTFLEKIRRRMMGTNLRKKEEP